MTTEDVEMAVLRRPISGVALWIGRTVTILFVLSAVVAYARWVPRWIELRSGEADSSARLLADGLPYVGATWAAASVGIAAATIWCLVGLIIALRRSRDLFGLLLVAAFVSTGLLTTDLLVILPMQRSDSWALFQTLALYVASALSIPWAYVFPDGRFVPRWTAALAIIWIGWSLLRIATPLADPNVMPAGVGLISVLIVSTVFAQAYRYRYADPVQRQQLKWLVLGGLVFAGAFVAVVPIPYLLPILHQAGPAYLYRVASSIVFSLSASALPIVLAIAILRQGLLDIDLLVNRALAHGSLTVVLVATFLAVSTLADTLVNAVTGSRSALVPVATALPLAVIFVWLRSKVVGAAARLMTGRRVRTLMFVDLVGSTALAVRIGDRGLRDVLERSSRHAVDSCGASTATRWTRPVMACSRPSLDPRRVSGVPRRSSTQFATSASRRGRVSTSARSSSTGGTSRASRSTSLRVSSHWLDPARSSFRMSSASSWLGPTFGSPTAASTS